MVLALGFLPSDFAIRAIIAGALLLLFAISCWAFLLEYEDEEFISGIGEAWSPLSHPHRNHEFAPSVLCLLSPNQT